MRSEWPGLRVGIPAILAIIVTTIVAVVISGWSDAWSVLGIVAIAVVSIAGTVATVFGIEADLRADRRP